MLKKLNTLKVKFPIITFFTYMVLISVILLACYYRFSHEMLDRYKDMGEQILNLVAEDIPVDRIPDYLSGNYDETEYREVMTRLNRYPKYFDEIYYLYAYNIHSSDNDATVLFDTDTAQGEGDALGSSYELEPAIVNQLAKLRKGEEIEPMTDNTEWGYLMTCAKPLLDSEGNCQGYLFVDFNLTALRLANIDFIFKLFILVFILMLLILYLGMKTVSVRITDPIEKMFLCLSDFKYNTDQDRLDNIEKLKNLHIKTNPEIQSLYNALISSTEDGYVYRHEFHVATEQLDTVQEKAYTDPMTGFGNKNAYEEMFAEYQKKIDNEEKPGFAVMVLDVNNLKYVNDTYGHEKGDLYIKGCCNLAASFCPESDFFRIGGDEFAVILKGNDYKNRERLCNLIRMNYTTSYVDTSREPWERYSASIGMAEYVFDDLEMADIFKRADSAM